MVVSGFCYQQRAELQTNEEWLQEYITGKPVIPGTLTNTSAKNTSTVTTPKPTLRYISHRTTKFGRVVLAFENLETGDEVDAFFNVDVKHLRGKNKGKKRTTGQGGQFLPGERSKFLNFWMKIVGAEPRRWSRVHTELHKLKKFMFTGDIFSRCDSGGKLYKEVKNLRII